MGGPEEGLKLLAQISQSPPPSGEQEALREATNLIQMAAARLGLRSPKAARLLAEAVAKVQSAREAVESEGSRPLAPPPDLGLGFGGAPAGPTPFPGMGM